MRMSQMSWTRGQTRLMAQAEAMSSIRDEVSDTVDRAVCVWCCESCYRKWFFIAKVFLLQEVVPL